MGGAESRERSAMLFTFIEARLSLAIDPWTYLLEVLTRVSTMTNWEIGKVTPELGHRQHSRNVRSPHPCQAAA